MQTETKFEAPWGTKLCVITCLTLFLFFGLPVSFFLLGVFVDTTFILYAVVAFALSIGIVTLVARAHFIRGYVVTNDFLIVQRLGPEIRYDLSSLWTSIPKR